MARRKGNMIGSLGAVLIGAAILLFVCTLVLNNLKAAGDPGIQSGDNTSSGATPGRNGSWASLNSTVDQIKTMLTVCAVLLGVLGIVIIGSGIIRYIGGGM